MAAHYIGIDVGGTKTAFGLFDTDMKLLDKSVIPSDKRKSAEAFSDDIISATFNLAEHHGISIKNVAGVGIGMPSFIKYDEGYIYLTSNLTNIKDFAAKTYFEKHLGVPVLLDNDSNLAALAEHRHGAGRGFRHMLYCAMSTGVSNGIIINNQLFRGSYGWAGETGHTLITPDEGVLCGCGLRGCFMSHISGSMIIQHVQNELKNHSTSILPELAGGAECITAKTIAEGCRQSDALAVWAVEHMAYYAGIWLFNLYQTFNINCFVFGGGLVQFGDMLFSRIRKVFDHYNQNKLPVYFKFAELVQDFGIIGAAELIRSGSDN